MKDFPEIRLMRSSPDGPVLFDEHGLDSLLPLSRPAGRQVDHSRITYRRYLEAIRLFVLDHWQKILAIVSEEGVDTARIQRIDIISEKHGSDYHPAQVRLQATDWSRSFVVNAALTERGIQRLSRDFHLLDLLRARFKRCFVPAVYFLAEVTLDRGAVDELRTKLSLGEWLERLWEFHVSMLEGSPATVLWDTEAGYSALAETAAEEMYKQAAFILTYYYDVDSGEEIFPWHHAAGDFVAASGPPVQVRLITVRQYASRWTLRKDSRHDTMQALLLFLANLSLRMRLDRLDGVGDIVWVGQHCAKGAMSGFLDALTAKVAESLLDAKTLEEFGKYIKGISPAELAEIFQAVVDSHDEDAPDVPVILDNLVDHILLVYRLIQQIPESFLQQGN
jgi:hypothetical protein